MSLFNAFAQRRHETLWIMSQKRAARQRTVGARVICLYCMCDIRFVLYTATAWHIQIDNVST